VFVHEITIGTLGQGGAALSSLSVAVLFLVGLYALSSSGELHRLVVPVYLIASLIAFVLYRLDKSAAQTGAWRTPESTLHIVSLIGGWPGALVAQRLLRHKSGKQSFQTAFRVTVAVNCAGLVCFWLLTR
jgi:uncharacterized membrane protein YsdA (DUF1294 family)